MTEQELFEKIQRNLADEIEREAQSRRAPITRGQGTSVQDVAAQLGIHALKRIPHSRWYAVASDPVARQELAALAIACRKSKTSLVHALEIISQIVPGWLQDRPEPVDLPPLPIDKITGERVRNPWLPLPPRAGETVAHFDHRSQAMIKEQSPRLARFLADAAKN